MAVLASAWAGIVLTDPSACVDPERLENETRLLLGDRTVEGLSIAVQVVRTAEGLQTTTTVDDASGRLWERDLRADPADCGVLPEALALSIQQGLTALPGWTFDSQRRRPGFTADLAMSFAARGDIRFGAQVGLRIPIRDGVALWTDLRGRASRPLAFGSGSATLVTAALSGGVEAPIPVGSIRLAPGAGLTGGPLWATGKGFDLNGTAVVPRLAALGRLALQPRGPLRLTATLEVPILRVQLIELGGDSLLEAPVHVGFSVGLHPGVHEKITTE